MSNIINLSDDQLKEELKRRRRISILKRQEKKLDSLIEQHTKTKAEVMQERIKLEYPGKLAGLVYEDN